ncbi:hypothetical protein GCM10027040_27520 [Halomonas shantousis]
MRKLNKWWEQSIWGLEAEAGLLHHRWFWMVTAVPILLGIAGIMISVITGWEALRFDPRPEGWGRLYDNFKVQFWVMALAIPLGATFSRMHSSAQNAKSLRITSQQNELANAIQHADYFANICNKMFGEKQDSQISKKISQDPPFYYQMFFPNSASGDFKNNNTLGRVKDFLSALLWVHTGRKEADSFAEQIEYANMAALVLLKDLFLDKGINLSKGDGFEYVGEYDYVMGLPGNIVTIGAASKQYLQLISMLDRVYLIIEVWRRASNVFNSRDVVMLKELSSIISDFSEITKKNYEEVKEVITTNIAGTRELSDRILADEIEKSPTKDAGVIGLAHSWLNSY